MVDLTVVKQIITEVTGVDGNLFRVGTRFLESKGRIYLSYKIKDEKTEFSKDYRFTVEVKEEKVKFKFHSYKEDNLSTVIYAEYNENYTLLREEKICEKTKMDIQEKGDFIKSLNEKLNR